MPRGNARADPSGRRSVIWSTGVRSAMSTISPCLRRTSLSSQDLRPLPASCRRLRASCRPSVTTITPPSEWDGGSAVPPTFPPSPGGGGDGGRLQARSRAHPAGVFALPKQRSRVSATSAWRLEGGVQPDVRAGLPAWVPPLFRPSSGLLVPVITERLPL